MAKWRIEIKFAYKEIIKPVALFVTLLPLSSLSFQRETHLRKTWQSSETWNVLCHIEYPTKITIYSSATLPLPAFQFDYI